jgi:hypothetical protein
MMISNGKTIKIGGGGGETCSIFLQQANQLPQLESFLETLIVAQLVKTFQSFSRARTFMIVFTRSRHSILRIPST